MLFSGSVKANLDPFEASTSGAELWQALDRVGLRQTVADLPVATFSEPLSHLLY